MKKNPKVGIVIPSYGRPAYLKQAVESAINQDYENLEVVVVDDLSPDGEVKAYLDRLNHPQVRCFINEKNLGTTANYDKGVRLLNDDVEWALILDNDDFLDRSFVRTMIETRRKYPQSKAIYGRQIFITDDGDRIEKPETPPELESAEDYVLLRCRGKRDIRSSAVFFNLEQFRRMGGYPQFPSGMSTDTVLIFALAFDNQLAFSGDSHIYIRVHDEAESMTTSCLFEKMISIKRASDYCRGIYDADPGRDMPRKPRKEEVVRALRRHGAILGGALLIQKYREIVACEPRDTAYGSLQKTIAACRDQQLDMPVRFLVLANVFIKSGINIENTGVYKALLRWKQGLFVYLRSLNAVERNRVAMSHLRRILKRIFPLVYLYRQLRIIPNVRKKVFTATGFEYCHCCGCYSLFFWDNSYADLLRRIVPAWDMGEGYVRQMVRRENEFCAQCGSVFRVRAQAKSVLKVFGQQKLSSFIAFLSNSPSFCVYEAARYRSFRNEKLKKLKNYVVSEFHPGHPFGETVNGVRNESLERLTFADESFNLVITSEVLEHVSDLSKSLSEIHRVLRPGGYHVFTIPVNYAMSETRQRALVGHNGEISHLLPPAIHGDDIRDGVLAFRDFGVDVEQIIRDSGFRCREEKYCLNGEHITSVYMSQRT
jgi:glycosyltransferase involved in cell wall biosynthesis